ncbi:hypothetical protein [Streptomyces virginiae]|uniref:hypothetical protein n=1 Tax=Streptomyces virginiae TaxID=1961 RepID=UPI00367F41CA
MNATRTAPAGGGLKTPTDGVRARAPYEMRPLNTDAERAAAAALVEDRARWLADRGIAVPYHHEAAYRDAWAEAVGLYEENTDGEEVLVGCLLLNRQPDLRPGDADAEGPGLGISLVYTAPGRDDKVGWLITLWASDFADRINASWVHAEVPSRHTGGGNTPGRLLNHLRSIGWLITGTGLSRDGEGVTRLRMTAQDRHGLAAMVHCTVPLQHTGKPEPKDEGPR